eukprot:gene23497-11971_t
MGNSQQKVTRPQQGYQGTPTRQGGEIRSPKSRWEIASSRQGSVLEGLGGNLGLGLGIGGEARGGGRAWSEPSPRAAVPTLA